MQVKFYVRASKKDKEGKAPFEVTITANGTRTTFQLKYKIEPELWNNEKQFFENALLLKKRGIRTSLTPFVKVLADSKEALKPSKFGPDIIMKGNAMLDSQLNIIKAKLLDCETKLMQLGLAIDAKTIKDMYLGKIKGKQHSLTGYYTDFLEIKKQRIGKDIVRDTYQKYETALNHFKTFLEKKHKRQDIQLQEINISMVNAFFSFMLNDLNISNNSAVGYMKKFKAVITNAKDDNLIETNPMSKFKTHLEKKEIIFLTKEELSKIYSKDFSENERLERVRDIFVFSCFTALSFADLVSFDAKKHIKQDKDGNPYIFKERTKTNVEAHIPLLDISKQILEKYYYNLPTLSNQKYNSYLKEIQDVCNIKKTLHSHLARHTCATLLLNNGVSLLTVSKILGHANTKITEQTYAKLLTTTIIEEVKGIEENLKL
ncbi:site-specific integrase [Dysgonomonas capnocytophagoides]|uniref:Site-specific integrase n=1 Tax=Dysgonomonas capnocytophagoides TaxID=45254 RepID=A0A4Y8L8N5_9BACT|nr:site-specific integrase [Dysgonomonas capnocytophagoides]TFD96846.1 site-specific integrase [Dysgonomonas capnocytophagoides]